MSETFKGKKIAVYLRRSKGESGTTQDQLVEITPFINQLIKKKQIKKFNFDIVGRSLDGTWKGVDLERKGDIYNEGDGFSGYSVTSRPVFMELLAKVREGDYDAIVAVSMDRYARNYGALSRYAYDLWGELTPPKLLYGVAEKMGLGEKGQQGIINEKVLASLMEWGGLAKLLEIAKGEKKRKGTNVDRGYLLGSRPEWMGKEYRGKTTKTVEYRKAWEAIKAGKGAAAIGRAAKKYDSQGLGSTSWPRTWRPRLKAYNELGVLDDWLDNVEAVNQYIKDYGAKPYYSYKSDEVQQLLKSTSGYFAYPAGVLLKTDEGFDFVTFPKPLEIGIARLAKNEPEKIDEFVVERTDDIPEDLDVYQTQPRSSGK